jgi:uncharacterized membrane protein YedE/YeeE
MENFTPIASTIGGILIGISAVIMLVANGRITGISGIFDGIIAPESGEFEWRVIFVAGLLTGGAILFATYPSLFAIGIERSWPAVILAGILVGFGTRLGNGCTSGHGVCGLSRFSNRSFVAVISFMTMGAITVFVVNHLLGGAV